MTRRRQVRARKLFNRARRWLRHQFGPWAIPAYAWAVPTGKRGGRK